MADGMTKANAVLTRMISSPCPIRWGQRGELRLKCECYSHFRSLGRHSAETPLVGKHMHLLITGSRRGRWTALQKERWVVEAQRKTERMRQEVIEENRRLNRIKLNYKVQALNAPYTRDDRSIIWRGVDDARTWQVHRPTIPWAWTHFRLPAYGIVVAMSTGALSSHRAIEVQRGILVHALSIWPWGPCGIDYHGPCTQCRPRWI